MFGVWTDVIDIKVQLDYDSDSMGRSQKLLNVEFQMKIQLFQNVGPLTVRLPIGSYLSTEMFEQDLHCAMMAVFAVGLKSEFCDFDLTADWTGVGLVLSFDLDLKRFGQVVNIVAGGMSVGRTSSRRRVMSGPSA